MTSLQVLFTYIRSSKYKQQGIVKVLPNKLPNAKFAMLYLQNCDL